MQQALFFSFVVAKMRSRRLGTGPSHALCDLLSGQLNVWGALPFLAPVARVTGYEPSSFMQRCSLPALLYVSSLFGGKLNLFTEMQEQYNFKTQAAQGAYTGRNNVNR